MIEVCLKYDFRFLSFLESTLKISKNCGKFEKHIKCLYSFFHDFFEDFGVILKKYKNLNSNFSHLYFTQ